MAGVARHPLLWPAARSIRQAGPERSWRHEMRCLRPAVRLVDGRRHWLSDVVRYSARLRDQQVHASRVPAEWRLQRIGCTAAARSFPNRRSMRRFGNDLCTHCYEGCSVQMLIAAYFADKPPRLADWVCITVWNKLAPIIYIAPYLEDDTFSRLASGIA